jgi:DNA-binding transcriptional LysR family regulator
MSGLKIHLDRQIGRRLRLRDLAVFSAVAEHQSMAKAAADLGVAQPTISQVIADLEYTYGVQLFDRSPRGVQLTVYGQALLKRSIAVFDEIKQSGRDIEFLADPTAGEIRIACVESLSATILPEILLQFARQYPRVVLHVDNLTAPATDMTNLRNRKYDLALVRLEMPIGTDPTAEDLDMRMLFDDGIAIAAGLSSPWARRAKVDLPELIDEPWILSPPGSWHHTAMSEAFRLHGLSPPTPSIVSLTVTLRMQLLAAAPYVSVFSHSVMRLNAQRFGIVALPIVLPHKPWPVAIVTLKNRTLSPVVERFIESAHEVAKSFMLPEVT